MGEEGDVGGTGNGNKWKDFLKKKFAVNATMGDDGMRAGRWDVLVGLGKAGGYQ